MKTGLQGRFGWCIGSESVIPHDKCRVSYVSSVESANAKVGDTVTCQCDCHTKKKEVKKRDSS